MNYEDIALLRKSHVFTTVPEIIALCDDLFTFTGLDYFTFDRIYKDYSHIRFTTHPHWVKIYYEENLYRFAFFEQHPDFFCDGYYLWSELKQMPVYNTIRECGIDHGITLVKRKDEFCSFYHFAFKKDFYFLPHYHLRNITIYEKFIIYFHSIMNKEIIQAEKNRIFFNDQLSGISRTKPLQNDNTLTNTNLSPIDYECLTWLSKGKTKEEIGMILNYPVAKIDYIIKKMKYYHNSNNLFQLGLRRKQYLCGSEK